MIKKIFKLNKKVLIFLALAGLFLVAAFAFGLFGADINAGSGNILAYPNLMGNDATTATYQLSYNGDSMSNGCQELGAYGFNYGVTSYTAKGISQLPELVDNIDISKEYETTDVMLGGYSVIIGPCSDNQKGGDVIFNDLKAKCKITDEGVYQGIRKAGMACTISGVAKPTYLGNPTPGNIAGFSSGTITVRIPKLSPDPQITPNEASQSQQTNNPPAEQPSSSQDTESSSLLNTSAPSGGILNWFTNLWNKFLGWLKS